MNDFYALFFRLSPPIPRPSRETSPYEGWRSILMSLYQKPDSKNVPSTYFNGAGKIYETQFWKVSDRKAQKNGSNKSIYWCKEQKRKDPLIRNPRAAKNVTQHEIFFAFVLFVCVELRRKLGTFTSA